MTSPHYPILTEAVSLWTRGDREEALRLLRRGFLDENVDVRIRAADVIGDLEAGGDEVVALLIEAVGDADWRVRAHVCTALRRRAAASAALGAIRAFCKDPHDGVRARATRILRRLGQSTVSQRG
jgi:HEAT repeat protein